MYPRSITAFTTLAVILLTACSGLQGSLLGGSGQETFTITYNYGEQQSSFDVTVTVGNSVVNEVAIEPGSQGVWRAHEFAFGANVRQHLLGKTIKEIKDSFPMNVGVGPESEMLTKEFREQVVDQLRN